MCWSRKVNHYPDIASLKFTLIRRWLSPKISRNLHKPKFWWIQRLFWCKKYGSIFQARHIARLERDSSPPDTLLLHIDLKGVVKRLGYEAATQRNRMRIDKRITTPTPCSQMIAPDICDLMVSSYLKNPFFKRFNRVLINTIYTNFENNSKQLFERLLTRGSTNKAASQWKNLGFKSANLASQFHKEAYDSWERNLHLLNPEKMFITSVSDSDELFINNKIICKNWKECIKPQILQHAEA